jgi:hypothetical protein
MKRSGLGPSHRPLEAKRLAVERSDRSPRRSKRALDAGGEIAYQAFIDRELAISEQFDDYCAKQRIVGRLQRHDRQRAQARGEIGQLGPPGRRRGARGDQHVSPLLPCEIEQVE